MARKNTLTQAPYLEVLTYYDAVVSDSLHREVIGSYLASFPSG